MRSPRTESPTGAFGPTKRQAGGSHDGIEAPARVYRSTFGRRGERRSFRGERRAGSGPARINVIGTCVGTFFTKGDGIEIVGRSPAESRIRAIGSTSNALFVNGPGQLNVRNLAFVDSGFGLRIDGPGRTVVVEGCEITGNADGVLAWQGATLVLRDSRVRSNDLLGVSVDNARVFVSGGAISDNGTGVYLNGNGTLELQNAELRGNHSMGVQAQTLSTVTASHTTFLDNGEGHAGLVDRSALIVVDSTFGQPGDATGLSIFAGDDSRATIEFRSPGIVYGRVRAIGGSNVVLQGGTLHDGASLEEFSWAKVTDATVEDTILCQSGSDAICAGSTSASVYGCGPVSSSCTGTPVPASGPPGFLKSAPEGGIDPTRH